MTPADRSKLVARLAMAGFHLRLATDNLREARALEYSDELETLLNSALCLKRRVDLLHHAQAKKGGER